MMLTAPLLSVGDEVMRIVDLQGQTMLKQAYGKQHKEVLAQPELSTQAKKL
jgi:hypothetical protein